MIWFCRFLKWVYNSEVVYIQDMVRDDKRNEYLHNHVNNRRERKSVCVRVSLCVWIISTKETNKFKVVTLE